MKAFRKDIKKINVPVVIIVSCVVLQLTSIHSYLLFHTLVEFFAILVAFGVFAVAWSSRKFVDSNFLLILGISYFFVGGIDLFHALSYKGMNIFANDNSDVPTQLWIIARYMEAVSFIVALIFLRKKMHYEENNAKFKPEVVFGMYFMLFVLVFLSVFYWQIFPVMYIEGIGLTPLKVISEYVISLMFFVALLLIIKKRNLFDPKIFNLVSLSLVLKIVTEVLFSGYEGVYGFQNMLGHIFFFISYLLVYKAVLEIGLMEPYRLLFLDLKRSQDEYQRTQKELQQRIRDHLTDAYRHIGITNRKISLLLEVEKHSQFKKNKKKLLKHITNTAKSSCHASTALVYKNEKNNTCTLIFGEGTKSSHLEKIRNVDVDNIPFLEQMFKSKKRINSPCEKHEIGCLNIDGKLNYFVATPFMENNRCEGFLFVGFKDRLSMENQELDFLDVYAIHVTKALSKLRIIGQRN